MKQNAITIVVFILLIGLFVFIANDGKFPWSGKPGHEADPKLARSGTFVTREREPKAGECPNTLVRITLAPEVAKRMTIAMQTVEYSEVPETLSANAETSFPPARHARVAPRLGGVIREVKCRLGQEVEAGAALATIDSVDMGEAKSNYLQTIAILDLRRKVYEQEKSLVEKKISAGRDFLKAESEYEEAKIVLRGSEQRLLSLGLSADEVKIVAEKNDRSSEIRVAAPFAGTIIDSLAVVGETASPDKPIFGVADLDRLWLAIDLLEKDYAKVRNDQKVVFTVGGLPGKRFSGKIVALGVEVDDRTRTARVWAEIKNPDRLLRAKMFGKAEITIKPPERKLIVPSAAVQNDDGDCRLVFVSPSPNVFQARKIDIAAVSKDGYEIAGGIAAGEKIVTTGSFLLKSEMLRGQMGGG